MAEKKKQENMLDVMTEKWMQLERAGEDSPGKGGGRIAGEA